MRKIINGVIYDTADATEITTGHDFGRPNKPQKTILYLSSNQNWYFVDFVLDGWLRKKKKLTRIEPIDQERAFKFFHDNQEIDLILQYFPDRAKQG